VRGQFILTNNRTGEKQIVPNTLVGEGADALLGTLFNTKPLGTFYMGLCNQVPDNADALGDITTEPTIGIGAYARGVLARNLTDWPTIDTQNGETFVTSKTIVFTASGADFDAPFTRLFISSAATGFVGTLFSYSAALASEITLADGDSYSAQYQMFMN